MAQQDNTVVRRGYLTVHRNPSGRVRRRERGEEVGREERGEGASREEALEFIVRKTEAAEI